VGIPPADRSGARHDLSQLVAGLEEDRLDHAAEGTEDIASINLDGSGFIQLTFNRPGKAFSFDPCFSPGGAKILFVHFPSTGGPDLYTMNPDGTSVAPVTRTPSNENVPE
jgi:hypothetical protein